MRRRTLYLILLTAAIGPAALSAPAKTKMPAKKPVPIVKPPPAPPKGKATFPKQKRRRPGGKIIKIFPGDKHLDPKDLAAAPTANQVAAKNQGSAIVKPPKTSPKPKRPINAVKAPR